MTAAEAVGFRPDGRLQPLNSYENRVYLVGCDDGPGVILKFYRPDHWSTAAILEEHAFALELAAAEIPVVAPLVRGGRSLLELDGFRYAAYPRQGGRWPELGTADERHRMGRFLGRIHMVGSGGRFRHRLVLDWRRMGAESAVYLLGQGWLPAHLEQAYSSLVEDLLAVVARRFTEAEPYQRLRLHGDCHRGNVLWTDGGPHFVDLDDCMTGPAVQDLWMLLSGTPEEMGAQLEDVLRGYREFKDFDYRELRLVEPLRTLRIIHYAAWLARRWKDPAFPRAFPWFEEPRFWEQHVLTLREQFSALDE